MNHANPASSSSSIGMTPRKRTLYTKILKYSPIILGLIQHAVGVLRRDEITAAWSELMVGESRKTEEWVWDAEHPERVMLAIILWMHKNGAEVLGEECLHRSTPYYRYRKYKDEDCTISHVLKRTYNTMHNTIRDKTGTMISSIAFIPERIYTFVYGVMFVAFGIKIWTPDFELPAAWEADLCRDIREIAAMCNGI